MVLPESICFMLHVLTLLPGCIVNAAYASKRDSAGASLFAEISSSLDISDHRCAVNEDTFLALVDPIRGV